MGGQIALRNAGAVELATKLVDLAQEKLQKSRLKDVYTNKALVMNGRVGKPGDFSSDAIIHALAKVWQEDAFEDAVQCLCAMHGLSSGKWNVATCADYPGQQGGTEARFSLHWSS